MESICKRLALILILIMTISGVGLLTVQPACAQTAAPISSVPAPSISQLMVKFIPNFINVTTTDPYTGANTTTTQNLSTIELSITNQNYNFSNGSTFSIYYNIRTKGHFEDSWTELYPPIKLLPQSGNYDITNFQNYGSLYIWGENSAYDHPLLPQSYSTYTTVSIPANNYPVNGQVDIQVEAMLGVNSTYYLPINNFINMGGTYLPAVAYVTSSDWSNAQTITIGEISASPTPTPTVPEFPSFTIPLLLSLMVVVAGLLVYRKEHSRKAE